MLTASIFRDLSRLFQGFFAPDVDGHQYFHCNSAAAMAEIVDAHYFSERLAIDRTRPIRVGIGDKQAHPFFVELIFRSKIYTVARSVQSRQDFIEVMPERVRWSHADGLWKLEPAFAPPLWTRQSRHGWVRAYLSWSIRVQLRGNC